MESFNFKHRVDELVSKVDQASILYYYSTLSVTQTLLIECVFSVSHTFVTPTLLIENMFDVEHLPVTIRVSGGVSTSVS